MGLPDRIQEIPDEDRDAFSAGYDAALQDLVSLERGDYALHEDLVYLANVLRGKA
jgi:hypothetical protein